MNPTWRKVIALVEITGGLFGLFEVVSNAAGSRFREPGLPAVTLLLSLMLTLLLVGIFMMSLVAGVLLWRGTPLGRRLSILVQLVQLPKIGSSAVTWMFSFGFDFSVLMIHIQSASFVNFPTQFGSDHALFFNNPDPLPLVVGFSFVSCIFLPELLKKREVPEDEALEAATFPA